jgi:photosystem II stability/assembly factor-like uncharacterized protein
MNILFKITLQTMLLSWLGCAPTTETSPVSVLEEAENTTPVFHGNIMQSADLGQSWTDIGQGLPEDKRFSTVHIADNEVYLGYDKDQLFSLNGAPVHSWTKEPLVEALSQHTSKTDNSILGIYSTQPALYVFVVQDGLYKMQRNSRTWAAIKMPVGVFGINDVEEDESGNIYLANETGVYVSVDGGQNWKLNYRQGWIGSLEIHKNAIIAGGKNGVYRSDDGGVNWARTPIHQETAFLFVKEGEPSYKVMRSEQALTAIRSEGPSAKGAPGKFQTSVDGGLSWQIHPADSYLKNLEDISSILLHEGKIFCSYKEFVICSEDNGRTWKTLLKGENAEPGTALFLYLSGGVLYCTEGVFGC